MPLITCPAKVDLIVMKGYAVSIDYKGRKTAICAESLDDLRLVWSFLLGGRSMDESLVKRVVIVPADIQDKASIEGTRSGLLRQANSPRAREAAQNVFLSD